MEDVSDRIEVALALGLLDISSGPMSSSLEESLLLSLSLPEDLSDASILSEASSLVDELLPLLEVSLLESTLSSSLSSSSCGCPSTGDDEVKPSVETPSKENLTLLVLPTEVDLFESRRILFPGLSDTLAMWIKALPDAIDPSGKPF